MTITEQLISALHRARRVIISAVKANVDLPDFNPADHNAVQEIDAALAAYEAIKACQERPPSKDD